MSTTQPTVTVDWTSLIGVFLGFKSDLGHCHILASKGSQAVPNWFVNS
jgi:hypothetical protein